MDPKKLSTAQQYLLEICNGINAGECSIDVSMRNPGCLNHSRWLTTANRILKLLVSIKIPSEKLQALVMFIIRVYAPMWFAIKSHSFCKDGARHFHQQVKRSRYLSQEQNNIIDPVLHRDSYFAHPENIHGYEDKKQRWSPRGHILKSLALASRPQVLENWPVLGSRTAVFFELLKFCEALENIFGKRFFVEIA